MGDVLPHLNNILLANYCWVFSMKYLGLFSKTKIKKKKKNIKSYSSPFWFTLNILLQFDVSYTLYSPI